MTNVKGIFLSTSEKFKIYLDFGQKSAYVCRQNKVTYGYFVTNFVETMYLNK